MGTIYIGGGQRKKSGGWKWKLSLFLILLVAAAGGVLKLTGPMLVERWINQKGSDTKGFAYSIRDAAISLSKGQVILTDVKVYNPETNSELLETPELTINLNWEDLILSQEKKVSLNADKVDVILSKDFTSEIDRIKAAKTKPSKETYLDSVNGKIGQLNIIEKKNDESRRVVELKDVDVKVKEIALGSVNKKSEFSVSSRVADGGKFSLAGKTKEENGQTPWSINGSLKDVRAGLLSQIAGDKLPFEFNEEKLNAEISAQSQEGKISGEISPDVTRVHLVEERAGIPSQSIKRILTDELTFSLPFTIKDELTMQYQDTYQKLKNYRKSPPAAVSAPAAEVRTSTEKPKSFWPF